MRRGSASENQWKFSSALGKAFKLALSGRHKASRSEEQLSVQLGAPNR